MKTGMPATAAVALALLLPATAAAQGNCLRPTRAGTELQGNVRICPGRYRIPDPGALGVLLIQSTGTRVDLTGVTLESGDTAPAAYTGIGLKVAGASNATVVGGAIRGFQYGILVEGGRGISIVGTDVSGSRAERLRSTPDRFDESDWIDIFHPDSFAAYGSGVLLRNTAGAQVTSVTARGAQNGIGLVGVRDSYVAGNDVSHNSGWGIHLWRSSHNTIVSNDASYNVRCESPAYRRGCDSAGLLLREESDSNTIVGNNLAHSGDGFFLSGERGLVKPSVGNLVLRNDATGAWHNAFESTFSPGNVFLQNHADSSDYGFWLGYSTGNVVQGNTVIGSRSAAIAIEHGSDNRIATNVIVGGPVGIRLFVRKAGGDPSRDYRVDDNVLARVERGLLLEQTSRVRVRGNLFDGVGDGLVVDSAGRDVSLAGNVFLRATRHFIDAPELDAGGNFWGTADSAATRALIRGAVTIAPWRPASAAGY